MVLMDFIEPRSRHSFNRYSAIFCHLQNIRKAAFFLCPFRNLNFEKLSAFRTQGFIDRIARINKFFHISPIINVIARRAKPDEAILYCCVILSDSLCEERRISKTTEETLRGVYPE